MANAILKGFLACATVSLAACSGGSMSNDAGSDSTLSDTAIPDGTGSDTRTGDGATTDAGPPICSACNWGSDCASGYCNSLGTCDAPMGCTPVFGTECAPIDQHNCASSGRTCMCPTPPTTWPPLGPAPAGWNGTFILFNGGANLISGIWFGSLSHGVITTNTDDGSGSPVTPGAVLEMTAPLRMNPNPLFTGSNVSAAGGDNVMFNGLMKTSYGLIALSVQSILVASTDNGTTFTATPTGISLPMPGEDHLMWISQDSMMRWVAFSYGGYLFLTTGAHATLGLSTPWVPTGGAFQRDFLPSSAWAEQRFWAGPGGDTFVWSTSNDPPGVDRVVNTGTTRGTTPTAVHFPSPPQASSDPADILVFHDAMHGFAASGVANQLPYVYLTSDGGATWVAGQIPDSATLDHVSFTNGFYAPDGLHVWLFGSDSQDRPVLYASTNGGMQFTDISTSLRQFLPMNFSGSGFNTGFALDATHIWLAAGAFLFYSANGGM